MDNILSENLVIDGVQYSIYGGKAYILRLWMQVAYTGELTVEHEKYKAAMKALRIVVEWGSKELKQVFASLDYKRNLKLREGPCGLVYQAAVLL